jgi:DNA invertase Pin-like site-specific DNA recombinase
MNDLHVRPTNGVAVAYLRTATRDQAGCRTSLERQRRTCEQYAHALGLQLATIYADVGVSGLSERRPALERLIGDLAHGRVRCVVIAEPYRLARSWTVEQRIHERIHSQGATISSSRDAGQVTNQKEDL